MTLRASPLTRLGAKCSVSRIWSNPGFSSLISIHKKNAPIYGGVFVYMAEKEGFEPSIRD